MNVRGKAALLNSKNLASLFIGVSFLIFTFKIAPILRFEETFYFEQPPDNEEASSTRIPSSCEDIIPEWIRIINNETEYKVFSQYGEDGVTEHIVKNMQTLLLKYYVEFGVEEGNQCNTRILREKYGWKGLMLDGGYENQTINLNKESIHPSNIVSLFKKYDVPNSFGYFSEDTDYGDYYLWKNILEAGYRPQILVSEINSNFFPNESYTVHHPGSNIRFWDSSDYFGVSPLALARLWNQHGYIMIYCTKRQVNCFGLPAQNILTDNSREALHIAQTCIWEKPIAWFRKIHHCDYSHELYIKIDEQGERTVEEVKPWVVRACEGGDFNYTVSV